MKVFINMKLPICTMHVACSGLLSVPMLEYFACVSSLAKCGTEIYVMAFTSDLAKAGSKNYANMSVKLTTDEIKQVCLCGRKPVSKRGDVWQFEISSFRFRTAKCIRKCDIKEIAIRNGGSDGWNIASIVTIIRYENSYEVLTANMNVNRWVDSNQGDEFLQYVLTNV